MMPVRALLFPYPRVVHGPWPSLARRSARPARGRAAMPGVGVTDYDTGPSL